MINKEKNGITEGAQVLFTLESGAVRPAFIVNAWKASAYQQGEVNLMVLTDFANDKLNPTEWRTSVAYSETPKAGTWSWPDGHACTVDEAPAPAEQKTEEKAADGGTGTGEGEGAGTKTDADKEAAAPAFNVSDKVTINEGEIAGEVVTVETTDGVTHFGVKFTGTDGSEQTGAYTADQLTAVAA